MVKVTLKEIGIGALALTILISLGYYVTVDDTHFCRDLEIGKKCDRLSSTEKTCYPLPDTRVGKKFCSSGWEEIGKERVYKVYTEGIQIRQELCPVGAPCEPIV